MVKKNKKSKSSKYCGSCNKRENKIAQRKIQIFLNQYNFFVNILAIDYYNKTDIKTDNNTENDNLQSLFARVLERSTFISMQCMATDVDYCAILHSVTSKGPGSLYTLILKLYNAIKDNKILEPALTQIIIFLNNNINDYIGTG